MREFARSALFLILVLCLAQVPIYSLGSQQAELKPRASSLEAQISLLDESIFPDRYPKFLKEVYQLLHQVEQLKKLGDSDRELLLASQQRELADFFRGMLEDEEVDVERLSTVGRARVGQNDFEAFLNRFGIDHSNEEDIKLEVRAQIERMRRREAYYNFVRKFSEGSAKRADKIELVKASTAPRELEYALRHCEEREFVPLRNIVLAKDGFGPQTSQDRDLLDHLEENRRAALGKRDKEAARKWRAVIAQLISQPVRREHSRLPFSKSELFAMMRNAERTLEQRKSPYIDITSPARLDKEYEASAYEIISRIGEEADPAQKQSVMAYAFFDNDLASELEKLKQVYQEVLSKKDTGQTPTTVMYVSQKKELLEILKSNPSRRVNTELQATKRLLLELVRKILEHRDEPYRLPFIRGVIFLKGDKGDLGYRFIEDFPMIVAGATYPYQWKHDNEVNIALLLANVDPYLAAQAVRFIIYHYMWRSQEAKQLGLYGWIPQIVFGNRQTGEQPQFENKTYYYFPDFRFRPTQRVDAEKERNRTSEIMQLPFFGWTVWRVYEELKKVHEEHAQAFLTEVYPYVRANTEAIRTALDPYDEAVLSGRDAWVNGMDNAWYHQIVMAKHLPERFIPNWAMEVVKNNRVDNRVDKEPGKPVDPKLAVGRPTEYYYQFKMVFYDIINDLGLKPVEVYHATPYNAKDVAITGVMARSLEAQIAMAKVLKSTDADAQRLSALSGPGSEQVGSWDEETNRYQSYLNRMKQAMNDHFWSNEDRTYYNRDVTQMFPGVVEQQFCRVRVDNQGQLQYEPRLEYWDFRSDGKGGGRYVLNNKARDSVTLDERLASVSLDLDGNVHYEYESAPRYWEKVEGRIERFTLKIPSGDPFMVEQFCRVRKDGSGNVSYEPDLEYWTWVEDREGGHYELNAKAKRLMRQGARRIEDGDVLRSLAIAGFFPLFGHIPSAEQAFELSKQVVNPWMWWPVDGIPIPTQPMTVKGPNERYVPNKVYDQDKYWLGPTWMASNKPVIDGFRSYGYNMMYLYIVQRTVGTLQDGRAVEHWQPETGQVNTTNVNFPWSASGMAGSIWEELKSEEQREYLRRFHINRFAKEIDDREAHKRGSSSLGLRELRPAA
ncbi:hypothetical protein MYX84_08555 [Acidobacteria bacterium AH-259-O06]|nr:hypothetical protein [Acidobacteria bacterium AH-259-O06]